MKKYIQKNWTTVLLIAAFTVGLSLLLYPTIAEWWNSTRATQVIGGYDAIVENMSHEDIDLMLAEAKKYNQDLLNEQNRYFPSDEMHQRYLDTLNVGGGGLIGSVYIPSVKINLPIYHTVDESILQQNIGHIEGSSLPVGGASTHSVISGHRGLPSAKLFTDIDQLEEGDVFMIRVLGKTFTYEVDQIRIVEPDEVTDLEIEKGKDLVTLVTCTPYGINSHRMLVRGHRIENLPDDYIDTTSDANIMDRNIVAIGIAIPVLIGCAAYVFLRKKK